MNHLLLAIPLMLGLSGLAAAEAKKYVEPGDSMYICDSAQLAKGLAQAYVKGDDFDMRSYAESTSGCLRLPPNAEVKFVALTDRLKDGGVVQVKILEPKLNDSAEYWINSGQLNDHIGYYNSTLDGSPKALYFKTEVIGCPTLQSAIDHDRLSNLARQNGALFLGMSHESKKAGMKEEFTCTIIRAHQNADAFISRAQHGFVPVQIYEEGSPLLWVKSRN